MERNYTLRAQKHIDTFYCVVEKSIDVENINRLFD